MNIYLRRTALKIKISPRSILIFVLSFSLLALPGLKGLSSQIDTADNLVRVISATIILGWFLLRKKHTISPITLTFLIMTGMMFISTLSADGDIVGWFTTYAPIFALGLLFEISLPNVKQYIKTIMFLMECLCLAHLLIIVLFPEGFYVSRLGIRAGNYLLGQKNNAVSYLLVACVTAFFYGYFGGSKFREIAVYAVSIISSILARSSTSMVGLILLVILFYLVRRGVKFNIYVLLGINVTLFLIFVVFRLQIPIFKFFIENVLKKSVTLTDRDVVWNTVLNYIRKRPLFGYGIQKELTRFGTFGTRLFMYAHNQILQELFDGGIVQLLLYIFLILMISRKLNKYKNLTSSQAMIVTLFALNIMFITEGYRNKYLYLVYYYAYYAPNIEIYLKGRQIDLPRESYRRGKKKVLIKS